jgi:AcrR family transcriptional regulator
MRATAKSGDRPPSSTTQDPWRERILAIAAEIFARDGYQDTDLQDVADALGIGKASVYRRFPSKQELFLAAVDDGMRRMKQSVDAAIAHVEDPLEEISGAVVAYLRLRPTRGAPDPRSAPSRRKRLPPSIGANIHRWRALTSG